MNRHAIVLAAAGLLLTTLAGPVEAQTGATPLGGARVANGLTTSGSATTGALLFVGPDLKNQFLFCSATLIGCRTAVTAARCVCFGADKGSDCQNFVDDAEIPELADLRVYFPHAGIFHVRKISIAPNFKEGVRADIAVLRLSEKVTGIHPAKLNTQTTPPPGTKGIISGFGGDNDFFRFGAIKRTGNVEIAECPNIILEPASTCWNYDAEVGFPGDDSTTCPGDEGGPLFVDLGKGKVLAGLHVDNRPDCQPDSVGIDVNVYKNRAWLQAAGGADINNEICDSVPFGGLPHVGDDNVIVQHVEHKLPRTRRKARFDFVVPSRTRLMRIAVNGDNQAKGDYDVYVAFNRKARKGDNDCQVRGVGQFAVCEFEPPSDGEINVLVQHVRLKQGLGNSRFEVTVSAFREPPVGPLPEPPERLRIEERSSTRRMLTWRDASNNEEGFLIQRKVGNDINEFFDYKLLPANSELFLDRIEADLIFTYRVRAFNEFGVSRFSNFCISDEVKPNRPRRFRASSVSPTVVEVIWRDRSDNESGFLVQRRKKGQNDNQWVRLGKVGQNATAYVDTEVVPKTVYEYRVRAQGRPGNCVENSRWSNLLEIDTSKPASEQ